MPGGNLPPGFFLFFTRHSVFQAARSMSVVDFILNLVGLLFWINWRTAAFVREIPGAMSIGGALRRAVPKPRQRWFSLLGLSGLLVLRSMFYCNVGPALNWTPSIDLMAVALPWRSDLLSRMFIFSCASFLFTLGGFYSWLLLLSCLNRKTPDSNVGQRLIRLHLGWIEALPAPVKLVLPLLVMTLFWVCAASSLVFLGIMPRPVSRAHLWEQGFLIGLAAPMVWRWLLIIIFASHILNSYLYLGEHPFWSYTSMTAKNLLGPALRLRIGPVEIAPFAVLAALLFLAGYIARPLSALFLKLPF